MRVKHPVRGFFDVFVRRVPIEAQLIVTRRCNLTCGYCAEYDEVSEPVPLATLKERIDALHRLRVINITLLGGEPLMHPQLAEIVAHADRRAQVSITTNGFLLTEPLIRDLNAAGLLNMEVSVDALAPDRSLFIQKSLRTVRPKLELLRRLARFDVRVNIVLCDRTRDGFKQTLRELEALGFAVSIDLLHQPDGRIAIGGAEYSALWAHYYEEGRPFSYIEQDYAARLLAGERPAWHCRSGSRFLYVDEHGMVQPCSARRRPDGKPVVAYTRRDAAAAGRTPMGCEEGCSLLCHYIDSSVDNQPLHTIRSYFRMRRDHSRSPAEARMRSQSVP